MIPRGLRVIKQPSLYKGDEDFITKWTGILNRCVIDLMQLIISKTKSEVDRIDSETDKIQKDLKKGSNKATYNKEIKNLEGVYDCV